ncbi:MAG: hypothetical protein Ct9H300mP1_01650 [Planctomycetaceae bacterium]|nr:MAG: hypothetical protein Ct9H300mP1_01650 [Planctomycetaceae bacterium]
MIPAVDALEATAVPADEQLSPATDVMRVLPTGGLDDVDTPVVPRDKMVGMRYRLDRQAAGSGVVGNDGGDTSFNLFWPFEANGDDRFMFLDVRALISDQGRGGTSLGMGYRSYNQQLDRIFGLSGWWDSDDSHHRTYQQAGASFESLGQFFDFRVNGYFPLSNEHHTVYDSTDLSNPYFGGFNLLLIAPGSTSRTTVASTQRWEFHCRSWAGSELAVSWGCTTGPARKTRTRPAGKLGSRLR